MFADYTEVNMTQYIDGPEFAMATKIMDPKYYGERLSRIPKSWITRNKNYDRSQALRPRDKSS